MAENTNANTVAVTPEDKAPKHQFDIVVNGVTIPIYAHKIKKGKTAGEVFLAPDFDKLNMHDLIEAFGEKLLLENLVIPKLRPFSIAISNEAKQEAGENDDAALQESYTKLFSRLDQRGESMRDLKARREELMEELATIDPVENQARFMEVATKIKNISVSIAEKKADKDEDNKDEGKTENTPEPAHA